MLEKIAFLRLQSVQDIAKIFFKNVSENNSLKQNLQGFSISCFQSFLFQQYWWKKAVLNMLSANKSWSIHKRFRSDQRAKQVVSDSPGLVDFLIGLVNSVLNLPNRQMKFT